MARKTQALDALKQRFGENLVLLRSRADISQEQAALRASLHKTEISLLERGLRLPRLDTIVKVAGSIEVEPCELLIGMGWRPVGSIQRGRYARPDDPESPDIEPSRPS